MAIAFNCSNHSVEFDDKSVLIKLVFALTNVDPYANNYTG